MFNVALLREGEREGYPYLHIPAFPAILLLVLGLLAVIAHPDDILREVHIIAFIVVTLLNVACCLFIRLVLRLTEECLKCWLQQIVAPYT